ncbi:MAG TPA: hypothetical protein VHC41_03560 [Mycobacteriales bacterium]|nr:hypothetical protein [Mycobacteriales bacterium]
MAASWSRQQDLPPDEAAGEGRPDHAAVLLELEPDQLGHPLRYRPRLRHVVAGSFVVVATTTGLVAGLLHGNTAAPVTTQVLVSTAAQRYVTLTEVARQNSPEHLVEAANALQASVRPLIAQAAANPDTAQTAKRFLTGERTLLLQHAAPGDPHVAQALAETSVMLTQLELAAPATGQVPPAPSAAPTVAPVATPTPPTSTPTTEPDPVVTPAPTATAPGGEGDEAPAPPSPTAAASPADDAGDGADSDPIAPAAHALLPVR